MLQNQEILLEFLTLQRLGSQFDVSHCDFSKTAFSRERV